MSAAIRGGAPGTGDKPKPEAIQKIDKAHSAMRGRIFSYIEECLDPSQSAPIIKRLKIITSDCWDDVRKAVYDELSNGSESTAEPEATGTTNVAVAAVEGGES